MNKIKLFSILSILFLAYSCSKETPFKEKSLRLWYDKPADVWEASLALGNGRLGAMPDGGIVNEKIVLNEISLWSGSFQEADIENAYLHLPQIQKYLLEGKNIEAQKLMNDYFKCKGDGSAFGKGANKPYGCFQLLTDLNITYNYGKMVTNNDVTNYIRELSLNQAVARTEFQLNKVKYKREYFTSFNNDVIVIRLTADQKNKINISLSLDRPENFSVTNEGNQLVMIGQLSSGEEGVKGMQYHGIVEIKSEGGKLTSENKTLSLQDADVATIYISATTDYKKSNYKAEAQNILTHAIKVPYGYLSFVKQEYSIEWKV